jgi:long-subunit acyl-CoA synthetase (AMP-forming)
LIRWRGARYGRSGLSISLLIFLEGTVEKSIVHVFLATAKRRGTADALRWKQGGGWQSLSWNEYSRRVKLAARAFVKLGLEAGQAVAILGNNRWEWLVADMATMAGGGVPAPIYQTCTPEQVAYIAGHCEAPIAVVENTAQLKKLEERRGELPKLRTIVLMQGEGNGNDILSFDALLKLGEGAPEGDLERRLDALEPTKLATLIYTSGTTGPPKGVMLSHKNLVFTAGKAIELMEISNDEHFISYLPLSHIAEQMMSIHVPVTIGATVSFAESLDKLGDNLREVRPTVFLGVPRVWEKIQAKMVEAGASAPPLRKKIVAWAKKVGLEAGYAMQRGVQPGLQYKLADKLVYSKVRARLGFDRCKYRVTAAAPISRATLEFFLSLGLPIYEVYGMSEDTGPATISTPNAWRTGFVGRVIPGTEVKIAPDGEILMRGDHVFMGYLKNPEGTAEALDSEGWLHSGDVGEFDADGYLKITDRKKDLIITAGGKNVAPQNIEALLKSIPGVGQAAVIGDRRKYLAALITLDPDASKREAEKCGARGTTPAQLSADAAFIAHIQKGVDAQNAGLAKYETVKKFTILPVEWTVDSGELTPTMKLKRKIVAQRYAKEIEAMYGAEGAVEA